MGEVGQLSKSDKGRDKRLTTIYGISLATQNIQRDQQNNACAICGRSFVTFTKFQDHDHRCCPRRLKNFCGKCNRGLLCYLCNKYAVGLLEWMEKMGIMLDKVVEYKKFWDAELKTRGAYEPKTIPKSKRRSKRKTVRSK